ncbi:hypothetical protein SAY87_014155 [Trapa incisa]|uniref:Protein NRT1/ PTR FAMILY 4.3 n=1 Tax=Trapa incisa TaxID=236973 RepID=A0AAN7GZN2_9MYRT|nr:hypothetical protein SAY87_014155 [Trapa incisa]
MGFFLWGKENLMVPTCHLQPHQARPLLGVRQHILSPTTPLPSLSLYLPLSFFFLHHSITPNFHKSNNPIFGIPFFFPPLVHMETMDSMDHQQKHQLRAAGGEGDQDQEEETTLDWRGRPSDPSKHGGMRAASFVLGLQAFEIMGIAAVGNNLITYVINEMHFSLSKAANTAHLPQLKPPKCDMLGIPAVGQQPCVEAKGFKALIFFVALYLVAMGSGCVKPNMIAHGADQFNPNNPKQAKRLTSYFNAAYFAFSLGELVALTVLVWVQTHSGMDIGFGVSAAAMATGLISLVSGTLYYRNKRPRGSIFTPIAQVFTAAILKRNLAVHRCQDNLRNSTKANGGNLSLSEGFRFLDKACMRTQDEAKAKESPWRLCTVAQVDQVKTLLSVIPIFACTIVFNTILAQLQTFSVQQGRTMDAHITASFAIPPASLQAIPYLLLILLVPLYDRLLVPFARRFTGHESGIPPLRRIGTGLFLATFSMVAAALMERKRRDASNSGQVISIFWITPQFLIFGLSEMFTAVGLIEFFYKQSLRGMQSFLTAMTYCSYSFGFYLSSVLVAVVNKVTSSGSGRSRGWLKDNNLNKDRLDLFYWLLGVLSFLNFLNYLFWSRWFSSSSTTRTSLNCCEVGLTMVKKVGSDDNHSNIP